jgi:hypothetical protein
MFFTTGNYRAGIEKIVQELPTEKTNLTEEIDKLDAYRFSRYHRRRKRIKISRLPTTIALRYLSGFPY